MVNRSRRGDVRETFFPFPPQGLKIIPRLIVQVVNISNSQFIIQSKQPGVEKPGHSSSRDQELQMRKIESFGGEKRWSPVSILSCECVGDHVCLCVV